MKYIKSISLLSIIFAFSAAQAETKVNGEFWGNFQHILDNGKVAAGDKITPMGFEVDRARILVNHSFNDSWSATLGLRADDAGNAALNRAFLTGKDWLAEGHTMHFGLQKNAYEREWDNSHHAWIHRSVARTLGSDITGAFGSTGSANLNDYAGLNYNIMINDAWAVELSLNNGPTKEVTNGGNGGTSHDVNGYGLTVMGKFTDNFGLMLGYDSYSTGKNGADESIVDNVRGLTVLRANLDYTSDMIDVGFEYAMFSDKADAGTDKEDLGGMALHANYKYAEGRSVYAYYLMTDGYDDTSYGAGVNDKQESIMKIGHVWNLDSNINTGLFYEANTYDVDDRDESGLYWRWAANF